MSSLNFFSLYFPPLQSKRFLFLEGASEMVDTEVGSLLLDRHLAGQMFVKQIWIRDMGHRLSRGVDVKE